jgi:hypothetical protein
MAYYNSQPPMAGLSAALAMQGRLGDSTLVHMNPMEVEMLKTMSPDGNLSYNPETGLPEAFKLKDIAAFALPIAASIAMPYLLPAAWGIGAVGAGAIGAGLGSVGAGLIQGKGLKDSLVQGGISGLMSYGMGSMMAPGTVTGGAGAIQGGTTAAPIADITGATASMNAGAGMMAPSNTVLNMPGGLPVAGAADSASIATLNQSIGPPAGTPTSSFADIGFSSKGSVQYNALTDVYKPGTSESGLGQMFDRASRTSPFGPTAFGNTLGPTQVPTYTQIGGSALGSAGQMYMDSMLSPEEMPYDIAGDEAYYNSRIPDLEAGRRRGRANVRTLRRPFESIDPSEYYGMATSPGGIGTFYAATGGSVPKPYGDTYGPGDPYGGAEPGTGVPSGTSGSMSSLGDPIADFGLGSLNPSPVSIAASLAGLALGIPGLGPAVAIGRGIAGMIGAPATNALGQTQMYGYGNQNIDAYGNPVGSMSNIASEMNVDNKGFDAADVMSSPPSDTQGGMGAVGDGGAAAAAAGMGGVDGSEEGAAGGLAGGGMIDFYEQGGGIASLAYGGNPPPTGYANQAFEGMVPGVGTGMSDNVPFSIEGDQPALLSRDEYVLPADVVSQLGDGSSGAGSDMLDNFISQVRQTKYGNTQQPAPVGPELMTGLMRQGGLV